MASQDKQKYDEKLLTRYLLGSLSREETERLDELSVVDDDFVALLNAAEDDLVDAYVRKELSAGDSEKFALTYLSSPRRRQKVEFAQTLVDFKPSGKGSLEADPAVVSKPSGALESARSKRRSGWEWMPRLAFAGMSFALLLIAGYLFRENQNLRKTMSAGAAWQDSLVKNQQQVEEELAQRHSANADLQRQLDQAHSQPNLNQLNTVALLLMPPTRGPSRIPTLTVHPQTDLGVLLLSLDTDEFPVYQASLRDAGKNIVWRSGNLQSSTSGDRKNVSVSVPVSLMKSQNYVVELTGIPAHGRPEPIAAYPFRAAMK